MSKNEINNRVFKEYDNLPVINGTWVAFDHYNKRESKLWRKDLRKFEDDDWKKIVCDMASIGIEYIIIQESFVSSAHYQRHNMHKKGYKGRAFYPSKIYPKRAKIRAIDPINAILTEADNLNLKVFLGAGNYAWFDYTEYALDWVKNITKELWDRYKNHKSIYGWYVSSEIHGNMAPQFIRRIKDDAQKKKIIDNYRSEVLFYFREFRKHIDQLSPDKKILLASNCHYVPQAIDFYPKLMKNIDILSPFGFNRMPKDDLSRDEVIHLLHELCDPYGKLWCDYELFLINYRGNLVPKPIDLVIEELKYLSKKFEKIMSYQFPGLLNAPDSRIKPGGKATVELFMAYSKYYHRLIKD
ncbi:MAG: DUF4434 domain-containing protein [Promethearchaeota archaeon]